MVLKAGDLYNMQKTRSNNSLGWLDAMSCLLIFLWVYAAASKLLDYQTFSVQLGQSPLLTPIAGLMAWFVPVVEILLAVMLGINKTRRYGLYGSFFLLVAFTAYIVAITRFSDFVPCSCGGILEKLSWNQHLVFNIGFVLLTARAIVLQSRLTFSTVSPHRN